jgi:hypothetical protein
MNDERRGRSRPKRMITVVPKGPQMGPFGFSGEARDED